MFEMIGNILNNLFSKPSTRNYPVEKREPFVKARGRIDMDIDTCIFCGICNRKCPANAITVNRNEKSWEIDPFKCIICGECEEVCPKKSIRTEAQYKTSAYEKGNLKYVQQPKPDKES
jgi:formate hydrogenlyase subunit 6/NADH:ubiquinone oxidoreductase subunit I